MAEEIRIFTGPNRVLRNKMPFWFYPLYLEDIVDSQFWARGSWKDIGAGKSGFRLIDDIVEFYFSQLNEEMFSELYDVDSFQIAILYREENEKIDFYHFPRVKYIGPQEPDPGETPIPVAFELLTPSEPE